MDRSSPAVHRRTSLPTITSLIASGALDAELAALVWLLVESGVPLVVAGERAAATATLQAFLDLAAPADEGVGPDGSPAARLTVGELARRADPRRSGGAQPLGATAIAGSLEELFRVLAAPPSRLSEDEIRGLGVVLVQHIVEPGKRLRIVAAHYLRPVERDGHGHLQRRPPAVLATWDPASDGFEHFAWGVTPELASRIGRSQAELERLQARRATFVHGLVHAGVTGVAELARAIDRYRLDERLVHIAASNGAHHPDHRHHDHQHQHGGHEPQA